MKKTFWDRTAKIYDHFMKKDHKAYKQMYSLIYPVVRQLRRVLFLATGALMSQTTFLQGESIPGIAHCVELGGAV